MKIIIHGGAGKLEGNIERRQSIDVALARILANSDAYLKTHNARETAIFAVKLLEDDPLFNAGYGSKLQADGGIRMSASIMDSQTGKFSAVINVEGVQHPIEVADLLSAEKHCVLAGQPATDFARQNGIPAFDCRTKFRIVELERKQSGQTGTVGAVVLKDGIICTATSTGGVGNERPGRVSDSPTVAGNFCTNQVGISATGIGEQIVHSGTAARIAGMMDAGLSLQSAAEIILAEARKRNWRFGFIAIDREGNTLADKSCEDIFWAASAV